MKQVDVELDYLELKRVVVSDDTYSHVYMHIMSDEEIHRLRWIKHLIQNRLYNEIPVFVDRPNI